MSDAKISKGLRLTGKNGVMDGKIFLIEDSTVSIGTDPNVCSIIFPENSTGIAKLHCQLILKNNTWYLIDFSDSGTWLNDEMIQKGQAVPVKQGDVFSLANSSNNFILNYEFVSNQEFVSTNQNRKISKPPEPPSSNDGILNDIKENFLTCKGRLSRKLYIKRMLKLMLLNFVNSIIMFIIGTIPVRDLSIIGWGIAIVLLIFWVICLVAAFALDIRRLHDTDHSGWWLLTAFIPLVQFYLLYLMFFKEGMQGDNKFGPDPLTYRRS